MNSFLRLYSITSTLVVLAHFSWYFKNQGKEEVGRRTLPYLIIGMQSSQRERNEQRLSERTCSLWTFINGFMKEEGQEDESQSSRTCQSLQGIADDLPSGSAKNAQNQVPSDADGEWDAIVRRRWKYVNPRYMHGRHHHLVPVINLCQRDLSLTSTRKLSQSVSMEKRGA